MVQKLQVSGTNLSFDHMYLTLVYSEYSRGQVHGNSEAAPFASRTSGVYRRISYVGPRQCKVCQLVHDNPPTNPPEGTTFDIKMLPSPMARHQRQSNNRSVGSCPAFGCRACTPAAWDISRTFEI